MTDDNDLGHLDVQFVRMEDRNVIASALSPTGQSITLMTAPASSIDGQDGPVVITDLDDNVLVVYSDEYIDSIAPQQGDIVFESVKAIAHIIHEGIGVGVDYINKMNGF